mmetsp:Transcript_19594/g.42366  ORF Transcript_19594/g.42366 Transcript_19594/m.42366 type:complete len:225 (+) Transcript_19594:757-1431(+)
MTSLSNSRSTSGEACLAEASLSFFLSAKPDFLASSFLLLPFPLALPARTFERADCSWCMLFATASFMRLLRSSVGTSPRAVKSFMLMSEISSTASPRLATPRVKQCMATFRRRVSNARSFASSTPVEVLASEDRLRHVCAVSFSLPPPAAFLLLFVRRLLGTMPRCFWRLPQGPSCASVLVLSPPVTCSSPPSPLPLVLPRSLALLDPLAPPVPRSSPTCRGGL